MRYLNLERFDPVNSELSPIEYEQKIHYEKSPKLDAQNKLFRYFMKKCLSKAR
jgi:hypothetical protein